MKMIEAVEEGEAEELELAFCAKITIERPHLAIGRVRFDVTGGFD